MPYDALMLKAMLLISILVGTAAAQSPWEMQDSHTKAGLRGIHAVDAQVAWASGTGGTILRTIDGGTNWTKCAVPPDAEKLDVRAKVPKIDAGKFKEIAENTKKNCPVSVALAGVDIQLNAQLG